MDAPEAVRLARTRERGWDADHHRARERAQASLDRRRSAATRIIQNAGTREDLERACRALFEEWTRAAMSAPIGPEQAAAAPPNPIARRTRSRPATNR